MLQSHFLDSGTMKLQMPYLSFLDPAAAAGFAEESRPKVNTPSTPVQTNSRLTKAPDVNGTPVVIKTEEKFETTPVSSNKNKRARRQKTQAELAKEEKKVCTYNPCLVL